MSKPIVKLHIHHPNRLQFGACIRRALGDALGWSCIARVQFVNSCCDSDVCIRLVHNGWLLRRVVGPYRRPDLQGMSVTRKAEGYKTVILINAHRWVRGPKTGVQVRAADGRVVQPDDPAHLAWYRRYLINHEFGHALGLPNPATRHKPGTRCSVMVQQTKSTHGGYFNPVPRTEDFTTALRVLS